MNWDEIWKEYLQYEKQFNRSKSTLCFLSWLTARFPVSIITEVNPWRPYNMNDVQTHPTEYGRYEVFRVGCKKQHYLTWNNVSWSSDNNTVTHYRKIIAPTK